MVVVACRFNKKFIFVLLSLFWSKTSSVVIPRKSGCAASPALKLIINQKYEKQGIHGMLCLFIQIQQTFTFPKLSNWNYTEKICNGKKTWLQHARISYKNMLMGQTCHMTQLRRYATITMALCCTSLHFLRTLLQYIIFLNRMAIFT